MPVKGSTKGWDCKPSHGPYYALGLCEKCWNRRRRWEKNGGVYVTNKTTYDKYLELVRTYGLSMKQCAQELGIKPESLERAIYRGRTRLRKGGDANA